MAWVDVPEEQLPEELIKPAGRWVDVNPEELPPELKTTLPEEKPSFIAEKGSELLGGALSRVGKATGLPNIESLGEDIKKSPGYAGIMKSVFGEQADIPGELIKGFTFEYAPRIETPAEAGILHKSAAGAAHLLGMGLGLLPVARGVGAVVKGVSIPAMVVRGGITGAIYGTVAKPEEEETRLGNLFKYAAMFSAFEGATGVATKIAARIPAVGRVLEKINKGEPLNPSEKRIQGAVELGRSAALGAGAGAIEPAETWEQRLEHMIVGAGTFGLAHLGYNVIGKAAGLLKTEGIKSPVGAKQELTDALKDPNAKPEQVRLAARLIRNRALKDNPDNWVEAELWDRYVDYKLGKNERDITIEGFEKGIEEKRLWYIEGLQKKIGEKKKTTPMRTPEEEELEKVVAVSAKKPFERTAEEQLLLKRYENMEVSKVLPVEEVTAEKPTEEVLKVREELKKKEEAKKPFIPAPGVAIKEIIPSEKVAELRAKLRAREIEKGKEVEVKEVPVGIKPTTEPEIIKGKPKLLPPTGKEYGETFVTVPESERRGTIVTPEIQLAKSEQFAKELETLPNEEISRRIESGELTAKDIEQHIKFMSPEEVKRIHTFIPLKEYKFPEAPKKVGKVTPDRFGYDIAEGRDKIVEPNIKQSLEEGTEPLALKEVVANQEARIIPEYESEADKDIIRGYFKEARDLIDRLSREILPAKGMATGKLPYSLLKETGKSFYKEGKTTFNDFRKSFIDLYGYEGFSAERNNILKVFNEIKNEAKIAEPEGDGYRIADERAGGQEHETFQDEIKRRFTIEYTDAKETFMSYVDRNMERMKDYIRTTPENEQEQLVNKMAKNIGMGSFVKTKLSEWLKVPVWDIEIAPVVKGLKKMTSRATEISNEFLRKNEFLKGYKPSQNMIDAITNTTLKDTPVGLDKLNPIERKMVEKIFTNTQWMMKQFEQEMRLNGEYLKPLADKAGLSIDDYITSFINKHKRSFYFPLLRGSGNYVVYAKGADGKTSWAENFETVAEAKKRALDLMKQLPDHRIDMFDSRLKYGFKFPELLEMLHDLPYMRNILKSKIGGKTEAEKDAANTMVQDIEDILSGSYLEVWAKGRLAKREGIKGFSTDIRTVLDQYAENFPRSFVRRWNAGRIADLVERVPEDKQQYTKNLVDYYLGRTGYEGNLNFAIRNVIYNWNLAFKPSFAILNLTQRGATTLWRAIKENPAEGGRIVIKSQFKEIAFYKELLSGRFDGLSTRDIINKSSVLSRAEKDVIIRLHDRGELESIRNLEIIGRNKLSRAINILATVSEKSNRFHSALTAMEIGKKKGFEGEALYDYTTDFVHKTQWLYGKENRPVIGRGWKAPLFVFKSYMLNDLNFLKDLYPNKKAFSGAIATRLALGGLGGVYGMGAMQSAVDWAMINIVGKKDWELSKEETKHLLDDKFGKGLVDVATRGLPSMVGLEGSITFGSPELFDIAALPLAEGTFRNMKMLIEEKGIDWKEFLRRNVPTVVKHQFAFSTQTIFGKEKITIDDIKHLPPEIRLRALEIFKEMPKDMGAKEKMLYAIGFSTKTPTDYYNALNAIKGSSRQIKKYKAGIHREIGRALAERKFKDIERLVDDAKERGIKLNKTAIMEQAKKYRLAEIAEEEMEE